MRMAIEELVKKTRKKSAKTVGIYFRDGSSGLSLDRTFKNLVLVVFLAFAKERCENTCWKVMHEVHALLIIKTSLGVLESERAHVEKIPCDVTFLSETQYACKVP